MEIARILSTYICQICSLEEFAQLLHLVLVERASHVLLESRLSLLKVDGVAAVAQKDVLEYILEYLQRSLLVLVHMKVSI